ncbi:hypothetical protein GPECTOR_1g475 [Gonium pectorale]|uniref:DNA-directed DNA polymerase X domain-containing protein n=1 Tax=Gonium pectorale TaxID=33097 RepID=A0A150H2Y5_GONPE|nr:hypothetical protein GPECTOR_1g475 [Gonium pectorale]|eukprot:KXZ56529.1 hypothetical protein GPECTOR_1g475 [Gonium pectorale]
MERSPEQCAAQQSHVTHLVLGASVIASAEARAAVRQRLGPVLSRWPGLLLLDESWLTQLLSSSGAKGGLPDTAGFVVRLEEPDPPAPELPVANCEGRFARWLGWWTPELDSADDVTVMLHAVFNDERCARIGNSAIVAGLRELKQYELAVRESDDVVGTRALAYARAAAAVQACSFRITPSMPEAQLAAQLPFVDASCAGIIRELAQSVAIGDAADGTGADPGGAGGGGGQGRRSSCLRLERFRADLPVRDRAGAMRRGTEGAASRRAMCKLPFAGPTTARAWYAQGCRSLPDALAALEAGRLTPPPPACLAWALRHHADLTAEATPEEAAEMRDAVSAAAAVAAAPRLAPGGWLVTMVGGGRRGLPSHDVDLLLTHPGLGDAESLEGVLEAIVGQLVEGGRLLPPSGNCSRMQLSRHEGHRQRVLKALAGTGDEGSGKSVEDGLDHVFGVFRTSAGRLKRLDIILCAHPWLPHALLGWSGSTMFLRLLHTHSAHRGLRMTKHALYRVRTAQPVPNIRTEADIFTAMGLPYREPQDRQCP